MYYLGVFPAKSRASAAEAQILQLTDSVLKRHRARREQGREDRSLVPVITYKEFSTQMGWDTCSPDETHFLFFFKVGVKVTFPLLYSCKCLVAARRDLL